MARTISLLTDFGLSDPFVGLMKLVIDQLAPGARVVDLTHQITPQNVMQGAVWLNDCLPWIPQDSVVCAVIDPGVGTQRAAIACRLHERFWVLPDNGLIGPVARGAENLECVALRDSQYIRSNVSTTFHGRDVFAPAAALLSYGVALDELGVSHEPKMDLEIPNAESSGELELRLQVLFNDRFGNAAFNLTREETRARHAWISDNRISMKGCGVELGSIGRTFADVEPGNPLLYWNSFGRLELAVNGGDARRLGAVPGCAFKLSASESLRKAKPSGKP